MKEGKFSRPRTPAAQPAAEPKKQRPAKAEPAKDSQPPKAPASPVPAQPGEEEALTPRQKLWERIKTVLTVLVALAAVAMVVYTVYTLNTTDPNNRAFFGYKAFIVRSDSMSATDFDAGDLVIVKEADPATVKPGDIISFVAQFPNAQGETFTHKVRECTRNEKGEDVFITYGTTTGVDDPTPVSWYDFLGIYCFAIPKLGSVLAFVQTPVGFACCIFVPILLILLLQGARSVKAARGIYKEKQEAQETLHQKKLEEMQVHVQAMEAQTQRMEEILAEMQKLKAEMDGKK